MRLSTVVPHPELRPFIHHFWVFESDQGLPDGDARVVVPNGRHKLIVPYQNALMAMRFGTGARHGPQAHGPGDPVVIGLWEEPSIISSTRAQTCTIGVEFLPYALTRFFGVSADELTQRIVPVADVLGAVGRCLGQRVGEAPSIAQAVSVVETFLRERLHASAELPEALLPALQLMAASDYRLEINELERRMGYSRRYLSALFVRYAGLPPKRLSGVLAFERLYRSFSQSWSAELLKRDALELFYDQSHFIRTFRRYTGSSPTQFAEVSNEFGRIFYLAGRQPER